MNISDRMRPIGNYMSTSAESSGPVLTRHRVRPEFAGLVAGIVGFQEWTNRPVIRRQVAGSLMPLVLSSGPILDVVGLSHGRGIGRHASFIAGLMPGYATTRFDRVQECVQIYLTPLGVVGLLGTPGRELAEAVVGLADAAPAFDDSFQDRLWATPTWPGRFDLIDRKLLALLSRGHRLEPFVSWMWQQIEATGGRARIGELIGQTGWSERHAISRFTEQIGLGPKMAARVVRFERAHEALRHDSSTNVAARFGFSDQSHLIREVRRFAGVPPTTLNQTNPPTAHSAVGRAPSPESSGPAACHER